MPKRSAGRGPELLAEAISSSGIRKYLLEQEMGVARGLVSRWLTRERTPGLVEVEYLHRRFGIAIEDWLTADEIASLPRETVADVPAERPTGT